MSPAELDTLDDLIAGTGEFWLLGRGLWVSPLGDAGDRDLYEGCCALEAQGRIIRAREDGGAVLFLPSERSPA